MPTRKTVELTSRPAGNPGEGCATVVSTPWHAVTVLSVSDSGLLLENEKMPHLTCTICNADALGKPTVCLHRCWNPCFGCTRVAKVLYSEGQRR